MNEYKITKQVKRVQKKYSKLLGRVMVILAIVLVVLGIIFDRGLFLPAFLLAALYYFFSYQNDKEYEYTMENGKLSIAVIRGKRKRKTAHELDLKDLEVIAPNWHDAVARYRKNGGTEILPKFDYTSYDDDIPYYTMIIYEKEKKIKLLLDLDGEMLRPIKRMYPQKVYLE